VNWTKKARYKEGETRIFTKFALLPYESPTDEKGMAEVFWLCRITIYQKFVGYMPEYGPIWQDTRVYKTFRETP